MWKNILTPCEKIAFGYNLAMMRTRRFGTVVPPLHSNSDEDGDDEEDEDEGYGNGNYAVDSVTQFREAVLDNLINGSIRRMTLRRMTLARGEMQGLGEL